MALYRVTGTENPTVDWTREVILERDEDGEVKKSVSATQPAELTKENQETLKELGVKVEKVSAEEAQELSEAEVVGTDVAAAAPTLGG